MKTLFKIALLWASMLAAPVYAKLISETVDYNVDGATYKGYIAYDNHFEGSRPGIIVVHEWWGHNDYARTRADMLASMGYVAFAIDMYGEGKQADHPDAAGAFASSVASNMPAAKQRFEAALELLRAHPKVQKDKTAAIGYCFGGAVVLNMALMGTDLEGVVSFHGSLPTSAPDGAVKKVETKILVCHGAKDPMISQDQIKGFQKLMTAHGADFTFNHYEGATHSFTNPGATAMGEQFKLPIAYHKAADQQSWKDMQSFFKSIFKSSCPPKDAQCPSQKHCDTTKACKKGDSCKDKCSSNKSCDKGKTCSKGKEGADAKDCSSKPGCDKADAQCTKGDSCKSKASCDKGKSCDDQTAQCSSQKHCDTNKACKKGGSCKDKCSSNKSCDKDKTCSKDKEGADAKDCSSKPDCDKADAQCTKGDSCKSKASCDKSKSCDDQAAQCSSEKHCDTTKACKKGDSCKGKCPSNKSCDKDKTCSKGKEGADAKDCSSKPDCDKATVNQAPALPAAACGACI